MNRTALEQSVYRDFGYADSPASAVSARVQGYLNDRHRRILTRPGTERLRMETGTFSTVASQAAYSLDMPIERILKLSDTTNDNPLYERGLDWYRQVEPDSTNTGGTPMYYIPLRYSPALRSIGGTGLWIVSTSASDTTQTAHVETIDTNGSMTSATATFNGTTRVQVGTATNHQRLLRFSSSAVGVGVLELYDASSSGNKVSSIFLSRTNAQFWVIALWPLASAVNTIQVDYVHHIRDFVVAYDEPQLPLDFHYLVAIGAKIDECRKKGERGDSRIQQWQAEWEEGIKRLQYFIESGPDTIIVPGRIGMDIDRLSNLGPAFPSGRW